MKKTLTIFILILLSLTFVLALCSCSDQSNNDWINGTKVEFGITDIKNPLVQITFSTGDTVRLELYPSVAPKTVENFLNLAKSGFYNGLTMHRIIESFMIQGGGYKRSDSYLTETEKSANNIFGEFSQNGWSNNVSHRKGVISMARATDYNSASSQFFICSVDCALLDGQYSAFGRVIDEESMSAVLKLSKVSTGAFPLKVGNSYMRMSDVPESAIDIVKIEVRD